MNARIDPVVSDLNRYMDEIEEDDRRNELVDEEHARLMKEQYDPCSIGNIAEGFAALTNEQLAHIENLLRSGLISSAGVYVFKCAYDYHSACALYVATSNVDKGWL